MEDLDYWRLCDELSIVQAALLIAGHDPSVDADYIEGLKPDKKPVRYEAAKTAISNALRRGTITGKVTPRYECDETGNECGEITDSIDVARSRVEVESLRTWMAGRGFKTGFFFPEPGFEAEYLYPLHDHYSPKLAAAIGAWKAVSGDAVLRLGKTVKQALVIWLRQHANEFGLTKDDGNPNEQGIDDVAKIANWDTRGGAPRTPGNE
jgi:hypothetical protein